MKYIDEVTLTGKRILLRVDFNVSLDKNGAIVNDERIRQVLPTITSLLKQHNRLIILSHLGRPHGVDPTLSLLPVAKRLEEYFPETKVLFAPDFNSLPIENTRTSPTNEIVLLENTRFFQGEERNDPAFAKQLASYGDIYVNDAFSVSHRKEASIVGLPALLPSYAGLLMKKEVETLKSLFAQPAHPFVAVLGGAKISTKIKLLERLIDISDLVLLGGGLANTFLLCLDHEVGKSLVEKDACAQAKHLLSLAEKKQTKFLLPLDVIVGDQEGNHLAQKLIQELTAHDRIFDIGPQTQKVYAEAVSHAKTILWNGPLGLFEVKAYTGGTDTIYQAIVSNSQATSIVGGGDTIASLEGKQQLEHITHVSTGGGAMLEFLEYGTLPGIEALHQTVS